MEGAVYRYGVPVDGHRHMVRLFGEIVHVATRKHDLVEFWALHPDAGDSETRTFLVVGTGHPLPTDFLRHVGTAVVPAETLFGAKIDSGLVWHLIEVQP